MARNRILVVEDDESINKVIVKNLTAAGYAVLPCFDGEEAAKIISRDTDFDLALLDVMLPGIDGFALLGILRISDDNSIDSGMLIPVWNFYGETRVMLPNNTQMEQLADEAAVDALDEPLLSINAIDGTIIDRIMGN